MRKARSPLRHRGTNLCCRVIPAVGGNQFEKQARGEPQRISIPCGEEAKNDWAGGNDDAFELLFQKYCVRHDGIPFGAGYKLRKNYGTGTGGARRCT